MNSGWIGRLVQIEVGLFAAVGVIGIFAITTSNPILIAILRALVTLVPIAALITIAIVGIKSIPAEAGRTRRAMGILFFGAGAVGASVILALMLIDFRWCHA